MDSSPGRTACCQWRQAKPQATRTTRLRFRLSQHQASRRPSSRGPSPQPPDRIPPRPMSKSCLTEPSAWTTTASCLPRRKCIASRLAACGPNPQICFALAEILYRLGDLAAARERYYMTIELDEEYVEARANLGCVLAESGERELAVAAFQGALAFHEEYADVHFHLARTLDDLEQRAEADGHWRAFLDLAPMSPWAATARRRLNEDQG